MTLSTLKNSHSSSNKSDIIFRYAVLTAAVMLILSFALKTAGQVFYLIFAVLLLIIGIFIGVLKRNSGLIITVLLIALFCFRIISVFSFSINTAYKYDGIRENIVAVLVGPPVQRGDIDSAYCIAEVYESERNLLSRGDRVLLSGDGVINLSLGDKVTADVKLSALDRKEQISFYSENVFLNATLLETAAVDDSDKNVYSLSFRVREYARKILTNNTKNSGMLLAILTGERSFIGDNFYEQVKAAGLSHILVVSGMHFTVLCGMVIRLLSMSRLPEFLKDILLLIFLFIMMCVCGFGMSILRASAVYVFAIIYRRLNRLSDSILTLSNAVILVLFIHPFAAFSLSFLLSFASTFGILILSSRIMYFIDKRVTLIKPLRYIAEAASVTISAYVATLPIVVYYFGYVSTYAILTNILVASVSTLMLVLTAIGVIFAGVPMLCNIILTVADYLAYYFVAVVKLAVKLPLNTIPLRNEWALTVIILLSFAAVYIIKAKPYRILMKKR